MASPSESFRRFSALPTGLSALIYVVIMIGATTRAQNAGLSCPDWPLCNGKLIPTFEGGVFFEWFHRLVAGSMSLFCVAMLVWILADRNLRQRLWVPAVLTVGLIVVQIILGALTVLKLLNAYTVMSHLGTGTLLFATLLFITLRSRAAASSYRASAEQPGVLRWFAPLTMAATYVQILLGGMVASNYASWACPDWPTCHGMWLPPLEGFVGMHMIHRYAAYTVAVLVAMLAVVASKSPDKRVRVGGWLALGLVVAQVALGVVNVLSGIPIPVTVAHNAVGEALLASLIFLNFSLFAREGAPTPVQPALKEAVA